MISDNAKIFLSEQLKLCCSEHGIFQKCAAPAHRITKELAEWHVDILKT